MYTPSLESFYEQKSLIRRRVPPPPPPLVLATSSSTLTYSPLLSASSSSLPSPFYGQHLPPPPPPLSLPSAHPNIHGAHQPLSPREGSASSPFSASSSSSSSRMNSSTPVDPRRQNFHSLGGVAPSSSCSFSEFQQQPRRASGIDPTAARSEEDEAQHPTSSSFSYPSSSRPSHPPPTPPPPPPPPLGPNRSTMSSDSYGSRRPSHSYSSQPNPPSLVSPPPSPHRRSSSSSSTRSPTTSAPPTPARSILEEGEEEELQRVLELSKLTHRSEIVSRTWEDGTELELDPHEKEIEEARRKEEEDLKRAMEESLRISTGRGQGARSGWVDEEFWGERSSTLPPSSSSSQPFPRNPPTRQGSRPLPIAPLSPTSPQQRPTTFPTQPHPTHSHSFPDRLVATSSAPFPASNSNHHQPTYSRTISLPASSSSSPYTRSSASTRRNGPTPSLSLFLANPSSDTPLPNLIEAAYANKGASELLYNSSVFPTIRGESWERTSTEATGSSETALEEEDALDEDGLLRDVALRSDGQDDEENEEDRAAVLEPDEEEIELQRRRREEMRRESFVGEREGGDASLLGGGVAGLSLADFSRRLSGGSAVLEDEAVGGELSSWGGLGWGHTTLSPPIQANAAPLTLRPLPPSLTLASIRIPPKSQGAFYIKASSYGALLSGLFTQAKTAIIGSGSYHLAVQFVKLSSSFSSPYEPGGEFSTILWLEDAGDEPPVLSPTLPHALAGIHNGFRSSVFHPTTMNTSLNSTLPIYVPSPSHIVKTSSNLIHTSLLQPINSHHLSRYNSPSSNPPLPQHTTLLAIPPCRPPTMTVNQLVDHLLALTTPTPQTKAISRRLTTLSTQYTSSPSSSSPSRFGGEDFYPPVSPSTALSPTSAGGGGSGGGGLLDDGPSSPFAAEGPSEDWYDDADDRVLGGGGVRSWLKHKKTLVVSKASGRSGRSSMMVKKSETLATASFITPFSIPAETAEEHQQPQ